MSLSNHSNLMKKVDKIIDRELIQHFDMISNDYALATKNTITLNSRSSRRNYYSTVNLKQRPYEHENN